MGKQRRAATQQSSLRQKNEYDEDNQATNQKRCEGPGDRILNDHLFPPHSQAQNQIMKESLKRQPTSPVYWTAGIITVKPLP